MAKVELTMQSLGVEYSSCCEKQFERGETMYAIVSSSDEPLGWWCYACFEKHQVEPIGVEKEGKEIPPNPVGCGGDS